MSNALVVLVPPSEAKVVGGSRVRLNGEFDAELRGARREVVRALADFVRQAPNEALERSLNARGPLLKRAISAAKQVDAHRAALLPAWQRYSGVVWTYLDPASMTPDERRRILVPSGLYGVTTSEDLVADYRLRMNVRLPGVGNVASFWRPRLVPVLTHRLAVATLVNLLPKEHEAAIGLDSLEKSGEVINVSFTHREGAAAAGHDAKAVKGILARRLVQEGIDVLESFTWQQWRVTHANGSVTVVR